jgi:hypothetical protein
MIFKETKNIFPIAHNLWCQNEAKKFTYHTQQGWLFGSGHAIQTMFRVSLTIGRLQQCLISRCRLHSQFQTFIKKFHGSEDFNLRAIVPPCLQLLYVQNLCIQLAYLELT